MKKYSALLLCIILAIQPLTSSFDQAAQPNSETKLPEETAEKQFSNHTGECGNNSSYTDLMVYQNAPIYTVGDTVTGTWHINCTVIGANYNLTANVWSVDFGAVSWITTWNWTAQNNHKTFTESFSSGGASMTPAGAILGAGDYCLNGSAWDSSGNNYFEYEFSCFQVVNGTSGGGGGGSNTDCGNNSSLTDLMVYTDAIIYNVGDTVTGNFYVNCTVIGSDYFLEYDVRDSSNSLVQSGFTQWTANTFWELHSASWSTLPEGVYCLNGTLSTGSASAPIFVDDDVACFQVVNGTSGGGGNNNPNCNNNTTDLFIWTEDFAGLPASEYIEGETTFATFFINCTIIGEQYVLNYTLEDGNGGIIDHGDPGFVFTANANSWTAGVDWTLPAHMGYQLKADLHHWDGVGWDHIQNEFWGPIDVVNSTSGGGGNNNTDCGNWTNLTGLFVWADSASFEVGDPIFGNFFVDCAVIGQYYELDYELIGPATATGPGPLFDADTFTWTAAAGDVLHDTGFTGLPAGDYCLDGYLHTGPGTVVVAQDSDCFTITDNNAGTSDCGSEHNMTQLWATQYSSVPYYVWQTINTAWVVQCAVIGEEYMLHAALEDDPSTSAMPLQTYWDDWYTFTAATPTVNAGNAQFWWLNPGDYCVDSTLYLGNTIVDNVYECFTVIDDPNWNNNNNNTNNNSGNSSTDPILPNNSTDNNTGNNTSFNFTFDVNWGQPTFIDPYVAIGYDYEISEGPNFASVQIPYNYGDGMYDIYLWDGTDYVYSGFSISTGTTYQFQSGGVDRFSIRGIEVSAELNPDDPEAFVTGLTFVNSGAVDMAMIPLTVFVDDPEPECVDDCPELISGDADGDGVPNEWDDCPNTTEGAATDTNGCEVTVETNEDNETETSEEDDDDDESGGGIPGFTAMLAISAVIGALIFTNRRIQKRLD